MLLSPFEISRTEFAWPSWQNIMLIRWVQLSMPLECLLPLYSLTILLKRSFGMSLVICEKSDKFTIVGVGFCGYCKITQLLGISNSYFLCYLKFVLDGCEVW